MGDLISAHTRAVSMSCDGDYAASRFEAEPILPCQFFEGRTKRKALEPEEWLMLAVLTDAVRCYQVGCDAQRRSRIQAFREAEQWLFSTTGYGPFSFENVCYTLDITPEDLRKILRKWRIGKVGGGRSPAIRRCTVAS
jgi:hypothetical protein